MVEILDDGLLFSCLYIDVKNEFGILDRKKFAKRNHLFTHLEAEVGLAHIFKIVLDVFYTRLLITVNKNFDLTGNTLVEYNIAGTAQER